MSVHTACQGTFHILVESVGAHCVNRNLFAILTIQIPDGPGSFQSVHFRHHNIHKDHIVISGNGFFHAPHSFFSVNCLLGFNSVIFKDSTDNFHIQLIILNHQDSFSREADLLRLAGDRSLLSAYRLKLHVKAEAASLTRLTFQLNIGIHHPHNSSADGKTKTSALFSCIFRIIRLLKLPENKLLFLRCNSNSIIPDLKIQIGKAFLFFCLANGQPHMSIWSGILQRISQKIYQNLVQPQGICHKPMVFQLDICYILNVIFVQLRFQQRTKSLYHLHEIAFFFDQPHLSALNLGHIQNIVDKSKQIFRGVLDFSQTVDPPLLSLSIFQCNLRHTYNTVHRSTDLMRHTGQEIRFRLGRKIVTLQIQPVLNNCADFFQTLTLFFFLQNILVNVPEYNTSGILSVICHMEYNIVSA